MVPLLTGLKPFQSHLSARCKTPQVWYVQHAGSVCGLLPGQPYKATGHYLRSDRILLGKGCLWWTYPYTPDEHMSWKVVVPASWVMVTGDTFFAWTRSHRALDKGVCYANTLPGPKCDF